MISPIERSVQFEMPDLDSSLNLTPDALKIPREIKIIPTEDKKAKRKRWGTTVNFQKVERKRWATTYEMTKIAKRRQATTILTGTIVKHKTEESKKPVDALTTISNRKITEGLVTEIF